MMEILIRGVRGLEPNLICHAPKLYRKGGRMTFDNMRELLHHSDEPISVCVCAGLKTDFVKNFFLINIKDTSILQKRGIGDGGMGVTGGLSVQSD